MAKRSECMADKKLLHGRKIVDIRYMTDEGNGPGSLFGKTQDDK